MIKVLVAAFFLIPVFVQADVIKIGNKPCEIKCMIAENNEDRKSGLMFRNRLEQTQGMLFKFDKEDYQNFWMKNTYIPLDIIYIDKSWKVVNIGYGDPLSEKKIPSKKRTMYVLEVNRGVVEKCMVRVGSRAVVVKK